MTNPTNPLSLIEKRTLELIKRFSHESFDELLRINEHEYATGHFDITTIKLIVEALMEEAVSLGVDPKDVSQLGLKAVSVYPNGQLEPVVALAQAPISKPLNVPTKLELISGEYSISYMPDGTLWFSHNTGEGMQLTPETLKAMFREFM